MNVNLMRQLWFLLAFVLLPLSAVGQRVSYGDTISCKRAEWIKIQVLDPWEAYESSTLNGPS